MVEKVLRSRPTVRAREPRFLRPREDRGLWWRYPQQTWDVDQHQGKTCVHALETEGGPPYSQWNVGMRVKKNGMQMRQIWVQPEEGHDDEEEDDHQTREN